MAGSLWAPISFSRTVLARDAAKLEAAGVDPATLPASALSDAQLMDEVPPMIMDEPAYTHSSIDWRDWWASEDARVYQFIGQDNIYFYCVAQSGMWKALDWNMQQSCVATNFHHVHGQKRVPAPRLPAAGTRDVSITRPVCAPTGCRGSGRKPVSFSQRPSTPARPARTRWQPVLARDDKRVIDQP